MTETTRQRKTSPTRQTLIRKADGHRMGGGRGLGENGEGTTEYKCQSRNSHGARRAARGTRTAARGAGPARGSSGGCSLSRADVSALRHTPKSIYVECQLRLKNEF